MSYLLIAQLYKQFGNFTALSDISLSIDEGEFVCFLGPSGCGKTTLLRAIAGLELQDSGRIQQRGEDISSLPPQQRDFGIVFQSYALFPNLTVAENIAYGLRNQRKNSQACRDRVAQLLSQVDLPGIEQKFPGQLSGGQQQRVALARALATEPGLLLLDEPLSALDARVRLHLRQEIRQLQRKLGVTTIMVTHDQDEALTMADRIVVMDHGCIAQVGTPREIYDAPASAFVARFIGTMNFVDATLAPSGALELAGCQLQLPAVAESGAGQLAFRPESVHLSREKPALENALQLSGEVEHTSFLGAFVRVSVKTQLGVQLLVDMTVAETEQQQIAQGQSVCLSVPAQQLHFFATPTEAVPAEVESEEAIMAPVAKLAAEASL